MLAAVFTLIQGRTKTPSGKSRVGEEVEGVAGRGGENSRQVHVVLKDGCSTALGLIRNRESLARQGDAWPLLSEALARKFPSFL